MTRASGYVKPGNWRTLKRQTLIRDEYRCYICGRTAHTADHVVPVAAGGSHDLDNLAAICEPCHAIKTDMDRRRGIENSKGKARPRRAAPLIEAHPNSRGD